MRLIPLVWPKKKMMHLVLVHFWFVYSYFVHVLFISVELHQSLFGSKPMERWVLVHLFGAHQGSDGSIHTFLCEPQSPNLPNVHTECPTKPARHFYFDCRLLHWTVLFWLPREVHELIKVSSQSLMSEAQDAQPHMPLCPTGCGCIGKKPFIPIDFPFSSDLIK